mgnify:CR=1 FL=1
MREGRIDVVSMPWTKIRSLAQSTYRVARRRAAGKRTATYATPSKIRKHARHLMALARIARALQDPSYRIADRNLRVAVSCIRVAP